MQSNASTIRSIMHKIAYNERITAWVLNYNYVINLVKLTILNQGKRDLLRTHLKDTFSCIFGLTFKNVRHDNRFCFEYP